MPTDVFNASGTWIAPSGIVGSVLVEGWGDGGGGADFAAGQSGGGGGGGGYSQQSITPSAGDHYPVTIGTGGAANGGTGSNALVQDPSLATVINPGGGAGASGVTAGGGGFGGWIGGTGGTGGLSSTGAGGGGSAFTTSNGNPGANGSSGGAGGTGTGNGGNGDTLGSPATGGAVPGGGGGGGGSVHSASAPGAHGQVRFTYTLSGSAPFTPPLFPEPRRVSRFINAQTTGYLPGSTASPLFLSSFPPVLRPVSRFIEHQAVVNRLTTVAYTPPSPPFFPPALPSVRRPGSDFQAIVSQPSPNLTAIPSPPTPYTSAQLGQFGVYGVQTSEQLGRHRIANNIAGYNLYVGLDAIPDLTQPPAAFSATLPFAYTLPLPGAGTRTYYILVRAQDQYGLVSQNQHYTTLTLDSAGNEIVSPASPPANLQLFAGAGGAIRVLALYPGYIFDAAPATSWNIWISSSPINTANPPTAVVDVTDTVLATDQVTYTPGLWYVGVALFRASDSSLSSVLLGTIIVPPLPGKPIPVAGGAQQ